MTAPGLAKPSATGWWVKYSFAIASVGATLAISGGVPLVQRDRSVVPTGATLALTMGTGWALTSGPKSVVPTLASLALTMGTPSVDHGKLVIPTKPTLAITGGTPTISMPVVIVPTKPILTVTGGTSIVATPRAINSVGASLTVTMGTPVVDAISSAHYSDDFNRADGAAGANWVDRAYELYVNTNRACAYSSLGAHDSAATYVSAMATDNHSVSVVVGDYITAERALWLILGANTTGDAAWLYIPSAASSTWEIRTTAATWALALSGTQRATSTTRVYATGDTIKFKRSGNVYSCEKNGGAYGPTWTDSGDLLTRDSSHRLVGLGGTTNAGSTGRTFDSWAADDI